MFFFFFSSRRRHTRWPRDWSSDVCSSDLDVMRILRDGGRTGTGMRLSKFTGAMVIVEIALSAALLTGAGLMTRGSVMWLQRDYGANVEGFMSARIGLPLAKYPKEKQGQFFEELI